MEQNQQTQQINIDPYIQSEMGRLNYQVILYKAQFEHAAQMNQELLQKIQELENKLINFKEGHGTSEPKN